MLICPSCKQEFEKEEWQDDDGPCKDGYFYCVACLIDERCGCARR